MSLLSRSNLLPPVPERRKRRRECAIHSHVLWLIFLRLPLKSLFRCKAVCKAFYSVVSDPLFNADYRRSSPRTPSGELACSGFFVVHAEKSVEHMVRFAACSGSNRDRTLSEKEVRYSIYPYRSSLPSRHSRIPPYYQNMIIASSGGILLCDGIKFAPYLDDYECYVMNPLTKEWRALPDPSNEIHWSSSNIGFTCQEGDNSAGAGHYNYEVVLLCRRETLNVIETYSSRSDQWSEVSFPSQYSGVLYQKRHGKVTKIGGVYYSILELSGSLTILNSYDPTACKMEESPLPVCLDINAYRHLYIGDGANGALQLCVTYEQGFDVWVKDGCSPLQHPWWRKHRIDWKEIQIMAKSPSFGVAELFKQHYHWKVDAFPGDPDKVLITLASKAVFLYEFRSEKLEMLHFRRDLGITSCHPYHLPSWHFQL